MASGWYRDGYRGGYRGQGYVAGYPPGGITAPSSTGLVARFKSDVGVTQSAGNVTAWVDMIGGVSIAPYSGHAVPFNASSLNNLPGLTFNANSGLLTAATAILSGNVARYVIVVCKTGASLGQETTVSFGGGPWFAGLIYNVSGEVYSDVGPRIQVSAFIPSISTPYSLEYGWDGNTAHLITFAHNGTSETVSQSAGAGTVGGAGTKFTIGNVTNGVASLGIGFIGDICEVLIYDHVLSAGDLATTRAYITTRYAI